MKCPNCKTSNPYTNNYCTSCGKNLRRSNAISLHEIKPRGCKYENGNLFIDIPSLRTEISRHSRNNNNARTLDDALEEYNRILDEIEARWWIVSPATCKNCRKEIEPLNEYCSNCNINHHTLEFKDRIIELKTNKNSYAETDNSNILRGLKWNYEFISKTDMNNYLNSLSPKIGESLLEYRKRLLKEWWETSAILYHIESELNMHEDNKTSTGGICGIWCRHFYETYETIGDEVIDTSYCNEGHTEVCSGNYCKYYEPR